MSIKLEATTPMSNETVVMVTGTSSGFGFLSTKTLLNQGYTVIAAMRDPNRGNAESAALLKHYADTAPGSLHLTAMDVSQDDSVSAAVDVALAWVDRIDVVVNNAGVGLGGFLESVTTSQMRRLFEVNLFGVHRVMRAVLPAMHAAGKGLVINVSSIMGRIVIPFSGAYTASKFALEGLSESWRYELSNTGVEVVIVEPGGFPTAFRKNMDTGADPDRLTAYGALAGLPDMMWKDYAARMSAEDAPNPQAVADAVGDLIRMPHGQRPFRTVVDMLMAGGGAMDINRASDDCQQRLLEGMSVAHLAKVKDEASGDDR